MKHSSYFVFLLTEKMAISVATTTKKRGIVRELGIYNVFVMQGWVAVGKYPDVVNNFSPDNLAACCF